MSDLTPKERAARIRIDFTIGPETEKRLRAAIEHECLNAMQQERRRCFEIADRYFHKARRAHDMVAASHAAVISDAIAERVPVAQRKERAGPNGDAAGSIPAGDAKPPNTDEHARAVILDGLADEYLRSSCSNEMARIAFYRLISVLAGCRVPPDTNR